MSNAPKLRKGKKMRLWKLTDQSTEIEGYVELTIFIPSETGELLSLNAELYVVAEMNVPLLLGDDFHIDHELGVTRHLEFGRTVSLGARYVGTG